MALYKIELEHFLGAGHSGAVTQNGEGFVDLSDEEVDILVELMKENETDDVEELELEERYPDIFEKLDDACRIIAYDIEELHWLWYGFYEPDCYDYDVEELKEYCREHCGFVFDYDKDEYTDDDGEIDTDWLSEDENEAFMPWLENYIEGLARDDAVRFFKDHLNAEIDEFYNVEYEVKIPSAIVQKVFGRT